MKIGFDVGDTLLDRDGRIFSIHSKKERLTLFKPFANSFDTVKIVADKLGSQHLYIISKCDEKDEEIILEWLKEYKFVGDKMIPEKNVYFCRERKDKGPLIKKLDLDVFIDDRLEVFRGIENYKLKKILFNKRNKQDSQDFITKEVITFDNWSGLCDLL